MTTKVNRNAKTRPMNGAATMNTTIWTNPFRRSRARDRKSTRLNSSHRTISYAVFCLKKKTKRRIPRLPRVRVDVRDCGRLDRRPADPEQGGCARLRRFDDDAVQITCGNGEQVLRAAQ